MCSSELPSLETDIWQTWKDDPEFAMFAVSSSTIGATDPETLADFAEGMGLTMPVLSDADSTVYYDWYVNDPDAYAPYPREFIVDRDGYVIFVDTSIDVDAISAVITAELGG